jgi:hypothetical protein
MIGIWAHLLYTTDYGISFKGRLRSIPIFSNRAVLYQGSVLEPREETHENQKEEMDKQGAGHKPVGCA